MKKDKRPVGKQTTKTKKLNKKNKITSCKEDPSVVNQDEPGVVRKSRNSSKQQKNEIGQPKNPQFYKERKIKMMNKNVVLRNYFGSCTRGYMAIFNKIFSGVESQELLEFLEGNYLVFLTIIQIVLGDQIADQNQVNLEKVDFKKNFTYELVHRSFELGLEKLHQRKRLDKKNCPPQISQIEIKTLYLITIMILGVGKINKKIFRKKQGQTELTRYHRVSTYLLDHSQLLTPKLFYMIVRNWDIIMETVKNQFKADFYGKTPTQTRQESQEIQNLVNNSCYLPPQTNEQRQSCLEQEQKKQKSEYDELSDQNQLVQELKSQFQIQNDHQMRFISKQKRSYKKEEICPFQNLPANNQSPTNIQIQNPYLSIQNPQNDIQEVRIPIELDQSYEIKRLKAIRFYNYGQATTRIRTKPDDDLQQEMGQQVEEEKLNKKRLKESIFIEDESKQLTERVHYSKKKKTENIFDCINSGSDYESQESESQQQHIDPDSLQTDQSFQENPIFQTMNSQNRPIAKSSSRQGTKHQSRQIDQMIDRILANTMVIAFSMANHIYHALKAGNFKISQQD